MTTISDLLGRYHEGFGFTPVLAAELEFYLRPATGDAPLPATDPALADLLDLIRQAAPRVGLQLHSAEPERGAGQLEVALLPTRDAEALAIDLEKLKALISVLAETLERRADFAAKPFANDYGSAFHLHLHLEDSEGHHAFIKEGHQMSEPLRFCLGGLLATMEDDLALFLPHESSRARLVPGWHAPVNASWGGNNRTVALRLPDQAGNSRGEEIKNTKPTRQRRIEHRLSGADVDFEAVITAILAGALHGLEQQIAPPGPIHGDAGDPTYGLAPLISSSPS